MSGFGAFASGLAGGYTTARELSLKEAEEKARQEKWDLEKPALELQADKARRQAQLYGLGVDQPKPVSVPDPSAETPSDQLDEARVPGIITPGNIDLNKRPIVWNKDGTYSTVRSITVGLDNGKFALIPTVVNGKVVSNQQALDYFKKTGQHLGIFNSEKAADTYAESLHNAQAKQYDARASADHSLPQTNTPAPAAPDPSVVSASAASLPAAKVSAGSGPVTPDESRGAENHLRALGDRAILLNLPDEAAKFYAAANQVGKIHFQDSLDKAVKGSLASDSVDPLVKFFNEEIGDGYTASATKNKDGTYDFKYWKKDGSLAGEKKFKDLDGVITFARSMEGANEYAAIKGQELKNRLDALKANADIARANAAQTNAEANTRRAAAAESNAAAARSRADAEWFKANNPDAKTDAGKWNADLKAGRVTKAQYEAHVNEQRQKLEHQWVQEAISRYKAEYPQGQQPVVSDGGVQMPPSLDKYISDYVKAKREGKATPEPQPKLGTKAEPAPLPSSKSQLDATGKTVYKTRFGPATWDGAKFHLVH